MPKKKHPDYDISREATYAKGVSIMPILLTEELAKPTTTVHMISAGKLQDGRSFVVARIMYKEE